MTYADLYIKVQADLYAKHCKPNTVGVSLFWSNGHPTSVIITATDRDEIVVWEVARNLFIAAGQDWARNAWLGGGDFGLCYTDHKTMMCFKPAHLAPEQAVLVTDAEPIIAFINHTTRILPPGEPESEVTLRQVDRALERILNGN